MAYERYSLAQAIKNFKNEDPDKPYNIKIFNDELKKSVHVAKFRITRNKLKIKGNVMNTGVKATFSIDRNKTTQLQIEFGY